MQARGTLGAEDGSSPSLQLNLSTTCRKGIRLWKIHCRFFEKTRSEVKMMDLETLKKLFKKKNVTHQPKQYVEKDTKCDNCEHLEDCLKKDLLLNTRYFDDEKDHFIVSYKSVCKKDYENMHNTYYRQQGGCDFCDYYSSYFGGKVGKDIKIKPCVNEMDLTDCTIAKHKDDKKYGIDIFANGTAKGYIEIDFCPMCGRKLD